VHLYEKEINFLVIHIHDPHKFLKEVMKFYVFFNCVIYHDKEKFNIISHIISHIISLILLTSIISQSRKL